MIRKWFCWSRETKFTVQSSSGRKTWCRPASAWKSAIFHRILCKFYVSDVIKCFIFFLFLSRCENTSSLGVSSQSNKSTQTASLICSLDLVKQHTTSSLSFTIEYDVTFLAACCVRNVFFLSVVRVTSCWPTTSIRSSTFSDLEATKRTTFDLRFERNILVTFPNPTTLPSRRKSSATRDVMVFCVWIWMCALVFRIVQMLASGSEGDNFRKLLLPHLKCGPALLEHCLLNAGLKVNSKLHKDFSPTEGA